MTAIRSGDTSPHARSLSYTEHVNCVSLVPVAFVPDEGLGVVVHKSEGLAVEVEQVAGVELDVQAGLAAT
jgi:hypothetical protein